MARLPAGVERVLEKAAQDSAFRDALTSAEGTARADVAKAASINLTPTEATVLAAAPAEELRRMIDEVAKTRERRRALVRLALGTAAVGTVGVCAGAYYFLTQEKFIQSAGCRTDISEGHFAGWLLTDDLVGPRSAEEILDVLRAAAPEFAAADWVVGSASTAAANLQEYRVRLEPNGAIRDVQRVGAQSTDCGVRVFLSKTLRSLVGFFPADGETQFTVRFVFDPR